MLLECIDDRDENAYHMTYLFNYTNIVYESFDLSNTEVCQKKKKKVKLQLKHIVVHIEATSDDPELGGTSDL